MKKFFKKAFVVLSVMTLGMGTTSCDSETLKELDWTSLLTELLGGIFKGGTTNVYEGTYTLQHLMEPSDKGYLVSEEKLTYEKTRCEAKRSGNAITITLPGGVKVGEKTEMSNITVYNLILDEENNSKLVIGEKSTIDGELVHDGVTYKASNLYIEGGSTKEVEGTISREGLAINVASIFFGENDEHVVNITFNGKIVTEE